MLDFTLLWVVTPKDYYSSMNDKFPTYYVISSCLSEHFNSLIQISERWKKYPNYM